MAKQTITDDQPRVYFDCSKCPGYCCSIYERVQVTKRDINRLAKHFGVSYETAYRRYTKNWEKERVLKRTPDPVLGESCQFLDPVNATARSTCRARTSAASTQTGRAASTTISSSSSAAAGDESGCRSSNHLPPTKKWRTLTRNRARGLDGRRTKVRRLKIR